MEQRTPIFKPFRRAEIDNARASNDHMDDIDDRIDPVDILSNIVTQPFDYEQLYSSAVGRSSRMLRRLVVFGIMDLPAP